MSLSKMLLLSEAPLPCIICTEESEHFYSCVKCGEELCVNCETKLSTCPFCRNEYKSVFDRWIESPRHIQMIYDERFREMDKMNNGVVKIAEVFLNLLLASNFNSNLWYGARNLFDNVIFRTCVWNTIKEMCYEGTCDDQFFHRLEELGECYFEDDFNRFCYDLEEENLNSIYLDEKYYQKALYRQFDLKRHFEGKRLPRLPKKSNLRK